MTTERPTQTPCYDLANSMADLRRQNEARRREGVTQVLFEHRHPGEILACLGEAWIMCSCGSRIDLPVVDAMLNTDEAAALFAAHQADALLARVVGGSTIAVPKREARERQSDSSWGGDHID